MQTNTITQTNTVYHDDLSHLKNTIQNVQRERHSSITEYNFNNTKINQD